MDTSFFKPLIDFLHLHPQWGYFFAFFFSFLEGLALVGLLIPGTLVMTAAGILAGSGILPVSYVILASAIGAFLGDYLSYGLGFYFEKDLKNIWPFKNYPKLLSKGSQFFFRHGGKSIFIGRFVGPMRPVVPLIAGSLKMSHVRFVAVDSVASLLWPPAYMLPGFIIGAASLALPADASTRIIIDLGILLFIICLLYWLFKLTIGKLIVIIDNGVFRFWQFLKKHPRCTFLYNLIKNTHIPDDHSQLALALLTLFAGFCFLIVLINILTHSGLYSINAPLHHFFWSAHSLRAEKLMLLITYIGHPNSLIGLWLILTGYFCIRKNWYAAIHLVILGILAIGAVEFFKLLVHSPRPEGIEKVPSGFSFPSGHATLSTAFFSYFAFIIARDREKYVGYFAYSFAITLIILISFSRLYLGAHWPTDVIGGILLGACISSAVALSYGRIHKQIPNLKSFLSVFLIAMGLLWFHTYHRYFHEDIKNFTPERTQKSLPFEKWWQQGLHAQPVYRKDRLGKDIQTLNIEWLATPQSIENQLTQLGWKTKSKSVLLHTIHYFGEKDRSKVLPLFAELYEGEKPKLVLTKLIAKHELLVLRLWDAHAVIIKRDKTKRLLVGTISYRHTHKVPFFHSDTKGKKQLPHPADILKTMLTNHFSHQNWKTLNYTQIKKLPTLADNGWNGLIFLIKSQ